MLSYEPRVRFDDLVSIWGVFDCFERLLTLLFVIHATTLVTSEQRAARHRFEMILKHTSVPIFPDESHACKTQQHDTTHQRRHLFVG